MKTKLIILFYLLFFHEKKLRRNDNFVWNIENFSSKFLQKIINNHKNGKKYSSNNNIIGDRQCNAENKKKFHTIEHDLMNIWH